LARGLGALGEAGKVEKGLGVLPFGGGRARKKYINLNVFIQTHLMLRRG
jgi:hypothetical protein